jgi:peptide/nickel transport system permease protein
MGLRAYILKRIIYSFILIILVITTNFIIFMMMPGDPTAFLMQAWSREGPEARERHRKMLRDMWGIGDPLEVQYVKYLRNLLTWNFGISVVDKASVQKLMMAKLPYTVFLLGASTIISIIVGILWGITVINRRGGLFDSGSVLLALIVNSLPTFWMGLMFLLIFYVRLGWFPNAGAFPREWAVRGYPDPFSLQESVSSEALTLNFGVNISELFRLVAGYASHAFLPMLTLVIFMFGGWLLLTRATMLETITEDYVLTARAKGLKERTVLIKHALKNASLPIITSAALSFGFILSGAIITESVFSYPGLGGWIWDAIQFRDYTVLMAIFYVISLCVIIANIIADLLYGVIDPRIKYG